MARAKTSLACQTRVRAWAEMALAVGQCEATDLMSYFRKPGAERDSTTVYSCLRQGRPMPALRWPKGEPGPALLIERDIPGTLKWLIHPMWGVLEEPRGKTIVELNQLMAALEPRLVSTLFLELHHSLVRYGSTPVADCEILFEIGSLDALAALLYIGLEAMISGDRTGIRAVELSIQRQVHAWPGLQALTASTRRDVELLLSNAVHSANIPPVNVEDARRGCALKATAEHLVGVDRPLNMEASDLAQLCDVLSRSEGWAKDPSSAIAAIDPERARPDNYNVSSQPRRCIGSILLACSRQ